MLCSQWSFRTKTLGLKLSLQIFVDLFDGSFSVHLNHNSFLFVLGQNWFGIVGEGLKAFLYGFRVVIGSALRISIPAAGFGTTQQSLLHDLFRTFEIDHVADSHCRTYFFVPRFNVIGATWEPVKQIDALTTVSNCLLHKPHENFTWHQPTRRNLVLNQFGVDAVVFLLLSQ